MFELRSSDKPTYFCRSCGYPSEGEPDICEECGGTSFSRRNTTTRILQQAELFQRSIRYLKRNAPYYPRWKFFKQADFIHELLATTERVEFSGTETHYITTKVRHEHEGTWYTRHHVQTLHVALESNLSKEGIKDNLITQLVNEVYLDLRFGQIDPDFKRPNGQMLDPVDELQQSEKERLNL